MKTVKIFLASSSELEADRKEFEISINRKNKDWQKKGVFLELVIWEDFIDAMSPKRLQDEYNEAIRECDVFVMLFFTKVGKYTAEEFETAFKQFKATNKPLVYTYFKDVETTVGSDRKEDFLSLWAFQEKLTNLGHFQTVYKNTDGLKLHFNEQLDKLATSGFITFEPVVVSPVENNTTNTGNNIPHLLTKPPFQPEVFLGRDEDLKAIRDKLFAGNNLLLLVHGEGGMGKTSLASKYFHSHHHEYTHAAWALSEQGIANALLQALPAQLGMQFDARATAAERLDLLITSLAGLEKPCLLVIDNANEFEDLEKNYQLLRSCPNFHVLITTRVTELSQAACHKIEGLPEAEALQLFKKYYPRHTVSEDGLFKQIRAAVGGNTLVIELLAKNLRQLNRLRTNYSLSGLLADLQGKGLLAISRSNAVMTDYKSKDGVMRKERPEDVIAAMYDLSQLPPAETALLSAFAVLPAESIGLEMLETLLAPAEGLDQNLSALAQKGWIEYNEAAKSFKCSPVVQEITKKKHPRLFEDCRSLIETLTDKLLYEPGTGHLLAATYAEAALFARYAEGVVHAFTKTEEAIATLCERIGGYNNTTGNLNKALGFYEECNRLEKELYDANSNNVYFKNNLAVSYERLGETHTALGKLDKALGFFEEETDLFKKLYEANPTNVSLKNNLAVSYEKLGETHTALGNLDKAMGFYEERSRLGKELYEAHSTNVSFKNGLAISYSKLGYTHTALGNLCKALRFYKKFNRLEKELYEANPTNVSFKNCLAISCSKLGETHTALGKLDKALGFYEEFNRLGKELYEAHPNNVSFKNGLAVSYTKLGVFFRDNRHDKEKAGAYFQQAEGLWLELTRDAPGFKEFRRSLEWTQRNLKNL